MKYWLLLFKVYTREDDYHISLVLQICPTRKLYCIASSTSTCNNLSNQVIITVRLIFFFQCSKGTTYKLLITFHSQKRHLWVIFSKWKRRNNLKFTWFIPQISSRWVNYYVTLEELVLKITYLIFVQVTADCSMYITSKRFNQKIHCNKIPKIPFFIVTV